MQLYAGLDVHQKNTYGTILDDQGNKVWELEVPTDNQGFDQLFAKFRGKHKIKAVFEASGNWNYIADLLSKQRVQPVMAHPMKVRAIASARIKTDKIDSKILADLLRADLIPESYMPSEEIIQLRTLMRYRVKLGRMSAQLKTTIKSVLRREGKKYPKSDITGVKAKLWLSHLELKPQNKVEVDYFLDLQEHISKEIEQIEKEIHKEAVKRPEVNFITSIPGFAEYSALLILAEIGDIKRFETPEQLAAYAGLVSSTHQSGNACYQGKITKQGDKWLRWILIQCCNITVRKENRLRRFYLRLARKKGHQKAITATARKSLTIIWTLLQKQEVFQP